MGFAPSVACPRLRLAFCLGGQTKTAKDFGMPVRGHAGIQLSRRPTLDSGTQRLNVNLDSKPIRVVSGGSNSQLDHCAFGWAFGEIHFHIEFIGLLVSVSNFTSLS